MGQILGMDGRPINGQRQQPQTPQKNITQTQAGAIIISEIEIAINRWNEHNMELAKGVAADADLFSFDFKQYAYTEEIQKAQNTFGYAELKIVHTKGGVHRPIYTKAIPFAKESELANKNAYFPKMAIDCLGFLLASGLLYNLALLKETPSTETQAADGAETKETTSKRKPNKKSQPGAGSTGEPG
jgi:hypothetical protein